MGNIDCQHNNKLLHNYHLCLERFLRASDGAVRLERRCHRTDIHHCQCSESCSDDCRPQNPQYIRTAQNCTILCLPFRRGGYFFQALQNPSDGFM